MTRLADPGERRALTVTLMRHGLAPDDVYLDDAMAFYEAVAGE